MSLLTEPVVIPTGTIITIAVTYLVNKYFDMKAGRNLTDLERLDYVTDTMVDQAVKQGKKLDGIRSYFSRIRNPPPPPSKEEVEEIVNDMRIDQSELLTHLERKFELLRMELEDQVNRGLCSEDVKNYCLKNFLETAIKISPSIVDLIDTKPFEIIDVNTDNTDKET